MSSLASVVVLSHVVIDAVVVTDIKRGVIIVSDIVTGVVIVADIVTTVLPAEVVTDVVVVIDIRTSGPTSSLFLTRERSLVAFDIVSDVFVVSCHTSLLASSLFPTS